MAKIKIVTGELEKADLSDSLKSGFQALFPELYLESGHDGVIMHPRIQRCIHLLKSGIDSLPFHGYDSLEAISKIFVEHFLDDDNQFFKRSVEQIYALSNKPQMYYGLGKVGAILDEYNAGGAKIIRAACLARTGSVDESEFRSEINEAVAQFEQTGKIQDKNEAIEKQENYWIMKNPIIPSYYHLILLAYTCSWRTLRTIADVSRGISNLIRLDLPSVYLKHKSQMIAPARLNLTQIIDPSDESAYFAWFDKVKLLLKAGYKNGAFIAGMNSVLQRFSIELIKKNDLFMKWGAYSGLALEPDWRSGRRKKYDLLYRISEIESLAKMD